MLKKFLKWLLIIIVIIAALFFIWKYFFAKTPTQTQNADAANMKTLQNLYTTYILGTDTLGDYIEITGSVEADKRSILTPISGKLEDIYVKVGDSVSKGDILAKFNDIDYKISYMDQLNTFELSSGDSERILAVKKLKLQQAEEDLENTTMKSTVEGVVTAVKSVVGDVVGKNAQLFTILDNESMRITSSVDEIDIAKIYKGMKAKVEFSQLGVTLNAVVTLINPEAVSSGGATTIPIELEFEDNPFEYGVISGLSCTVKLMEFELKEGYLVPNNALNTDETGKYVIKTDRTGATEEKIYTEILNQGTNYTNIKADSIKKGDILKIKPSASEINRLGEKYFGFQQNTGFGMTTSTERQINRAIRNP